MGRGWRKWMKWLIWVVTAVALAGCALPVKEDNNLSRAVTSGLPNLGPADLRGKVVLLDMWTFG
jgi:hypothetical protein